MIPIASQWTWSKATQAMQTRSFHSMRSTLDTSVWLDFDDNLAYSVGNAPHIANHIKILSSRTQINEPSLPFVYVLRQYIARYSSHHHVPKIVPSEFRTRSVFEGTFSLHHCWPGSAWHFQHCLFVHQQRREKFYLVRVPFPCQMMVRWFDRRLGSARFQAQHRVRIRCMRWNSRGHKKGSKSRFEYLL